MVWAYLHQESATCCARAISCAISASFKYTISPASLYRLMRTPLCARATWALDSSQFFFFSQTSLRRRT